MIVCSCFRVSDRDVKAAIRHGAGTVEAIGAACDAGTGCGSCEPTLCALLQARPTGVADWLRAHRRTGVPHAG